jgi:hypothetical protein
MKTLNQIAENIAFKLGDQFNSTLKESIKSTILDYRAKYIRDDLDRNFLSDAHFSQTGTVKFEKVNLIKEFNDNFGIVSAICPDILNQENYFVLKSTKIIPLPIRTKGSSNSLYSYLGSPLGNTRFVYTSLDKFYYYKYLPYNLKTIYYTVINNYIYILNNLDKCDLTDANTIAFALIKDVFEDPAAFFNNCENADTWADDAPFPIGIDMLTTMSNAILKGEYPLTPKDGQTVNIKPDDND